MPGTVVHTARADTTTTAWEIVMPLNVSTGPNGRFVRTDSAERFWLKVDKTDGCWERSGARNSGGYSWFYDGDRYLQSHRYAWELASGEILTSDDTICHTCDNRPCVRNDEQGTYTVDDIAYPRWGHLFKSQGALANVRDKVAKGRMNPAYGDRAAARKHPERVQRGADHWMRRTPERRAIGEKVGGAKLTSEQVQEIRERYAAGGIYQYTLAEMYGVHKATIQLIVAGKNWRHLE